MGRSMKKYSGVAVSGIGKADRNTKIAWFTFIFTFFNHQNQIQRSNIW